MTALATRLALPRGEQAAGGTEAGCGRKRVRAFATLRGQRGACTVVWRRRHAGWGADGRRPPHVDSSCWEWPFDHTRGTRGCGGGASGSLRTAVRRRAPPAPGTASWVTWFHSPITSQLEDLRHRGRRRWGAPHTPPARYPPLGSRSRTLPGRIRSAARAGPTMQAISGVPRG